MVMPDPYYLHIEKKFVYFEILHKFVPEGPLGSKSRNVWWIKKYLYEQ